jgi:hypothetical protein
MARPRGAANKNKSFLLSRLQDMYGDEFHPIMNMAENAVKLQKAADQEPEPANFKAALEGWEKIAQYVEPKLKSVDVNADVNMSAVDMSQWTEKQIDDYIRKHTDK